MSPRLLKLNQLDRRTEIPKPDEWAVPVFHAYTNNVLYALSVEDLCNAIIEEVSKNKEILIIKGETHISFIRKTGHEIRSQKDSNISG